jgi:hypothetical protein
LPVPKDAVLKIRRFADDGGGVMSTEKVTAKGSNVSLKYGSKPIFVEF